MAQWWRVIRGASVARSTLNHCRGQGQDHRGEVVISTDPHRAADELASWAEGLERKAQQFRELHTQMASAHVTHTSRSGRVQVSIDGNGLPTDILLTDSARGVDPSSLSAEIMETLREAQAQLRESVASAVQATVGDDPAGADILNQYRQRFPDPAEGEERPADDDEYFENRSILDNGDEGRR